MAAVKAKKGVMVTVVAKSPITHNGDAYAVGETLEIDEGGLQQLLDVAAVELPAADEPAAGNPEA